VPCSLYPVEYNSFGDGIQFNAVLRADSSAFSSWDREWQEAHIGATPARMLDGRAFLAASRTAGALPQLVARCVSAPPNYCDGTSERRVMWTSLAIDPHPRRGALKVAQCRSFAGKTLHRCRLDLAREQGFRDCHARAAVRRENRASRHPYRNCSTITFDMKRTDRVSLPP
jgi:hypothetical protein